MASRNDPIQRKVQLTGGSTYTVSLPKDWASTQGIESGSTVRLYSRGEQLVLADATQDTDRRRAHIAADKQTPEELARRVIAAYVAGAEEIRISGAPDTTQRRIIRDTITGLIGIEIHEETPETVTARTMLDVEDLSAEQTLMQMELTARSMHEEAIQAVIEGSHTDAERIIRQDDDVDRLFRLVCREFQRSLVDVSVSRRLGELTTFDYYTVARQIERVADHSEKIATVATQGATPPPADLATELTEQGTAARTAVQRALSGVLDSDQAALNQALVTAEEVVETTDTLDRRLHERDVADSYLLGTVVDSLRRTAEYGANLAEAGLNASTRRQW